MKYIWKTARFIMILTLISALVCGTGAAVRAEADGEPLDFGRTGSVSLTLKDSKGNVETDGAVTIYEVALFFQEDGDMTYAYTEEFSDCMQELDAESTVVLDADDRTLAAALAEYVAENEISGTVADINPDGTARFEGLELGLYLVVQTSQSTGFSTISPFLVSVPYAEENTWIYDVDATPKVEVSSTSDQPGESPGDSPGESPEETPDDSSDDSPEDTPEETPEETSEETPEETPEETSEESPDSPDEMSEAAMPYLPQTGQLNWPVPVLAVSGLVFFAIGWGIYTSDSRKRNHAE